MAAQPTTHHGALDGGVAGAVLGHEGHHGHTGRDAAIGGIGGHIAENHHEHHGHGHHHPATAGTGAGVGNAATGATMGGGAVGGAGVAKPTMGDKISGAVDVAVGKVTNNPAKVEVGEIKKTEGKAGLNAGY